MEIYNYHHRQTRIMCRAQLIFPTMFQHVKTVFSVLVLALNLVRPAAEVTVLRSTPAEIVVHIENTLASPDDILPIPLLIGLPTNEFPPVELTGSDPQHIPFAMTDSLSVGVRWVQKQLYQGIRTATLLVGPGAGEGRAYGELTLRVSFPQSNAGTGRALSAQALPAQNILNWSVARHWVQIPKQRRNKTLSRPSGNWIKITVTEDGPTLITGEQLLNLSSTVNGKDPRSFALYTGVREGRSFSQTPNQPMPDNLKEVAVLFPGEGDGSLDAGDTLLWYGRGASGFDVNGLTVSWSQNLYFTENFYWLLIPDDNQFRGLRMNMRDDSGQNAIPVTEAPTYLHSEFDLFNPYESGLLWVQNSIQPGGSQTVPFTLDHPSSDSPNATLTTRFYGGTSSGTTTF
ncbi:MAG: hypothetical protein ACE5D1_00685, partial [Fidelibacterota bacterium]